MGKNIRSMLIDHPKLFQNFADVNQKYIYTMYIYRISMCMQNMAEFPTVILWGFYGYPTVRKGLSTDFRVKNCPKLSKIANG